MDIVMEIIKDPGQGLLLLLFAMALAGVVALLVWAVVAAIRWGTRGRNVKAFGVELKDGAPVLESDGTCDEDDDCGGYRGPDRRSPTAEVYKAIKGAVWVARKLFQMERAIVTAQKDIISSQRPAFFAALEKVSIPAIFGRLFLVEFEDVFQLAAEYNHITEKVDQSREWIDQDYLQSKLHALELRYQSTATILAAGIDWPPIERHLRAVVIEVLYSFQVVADARREDLARDIAEIKANLGASEALSTYLDEVVLEVRV